MNYRDGNDCVDMVFNMACRVCGFDKRTSECITFKPACRMKTSVGSRVLGNWATDCSVPAFFRDTLGMLY